MLALIQDALAALGAALAAVLLGLWLLLGWRTYRAQHHRDRAGGETATRPRARQQPCERDRGGESATEPLPRPHAPRPDQSQEGGG